jgi:hypothetical protein
MRKDYDPPELKTLGTIEEITQAVGGRPVDGADGSVPV